MVSTKIKPKKVILFCNSSLSILLYRLPLIKDIVKKGYKLQIWGPPDQDSVKVIEELNKIKIKYNFVKINNASFNLFNDIRLMFNILILLRKESPDFLMCYTLKPILYGSFCSAVKGGVKTYSFVTGLGYVFTENTFLIRLLRFFVKQAYKAAFFLNERVFFQNQEDRKIFDLPLLNPRFDVIAGSGVDLAYYSYSPPSVTKKKMTFLFIGRLLKHKGILEFVAAAKILKSKYKNSSFIVVGDLTPNPSCISRETLEKWKKERYISYKGYHEDIRPFLKETSVFVLPSYREGIPKSVLEAMSMGRPVITTRAPGCQDTVEEGRNGWLVEKQNVPDLVAAMEKFLKNPHFILQMGKESRKIAEEKFDIKKINENLLQGMGIRDT